MVQPAPAPRSTAIKARESEPAQRRQRSNLQVRDGQSSGPMPDWRALALASPRVVQLQRLRALVAGARRELSRRASPLTAPSEDARQQGPSPSPGTGLPEGLQRGIEALSGLAMDHVRVHYNSLWPARVHAHAYAEGSDIHLSPGQDRHLPHEAWHLVQQAQGRVRPTLQRNGAVAINDDPALELEADQMGARALRLGGG
ncbi:MAG: DUF4157 domain-containing protein [Cyanobacteriota bacterium]|nr:DUF4157 domain-containing protein [Cyanobacteriota bacterium]